MSLTKTVDEQRGSVHARENYKPSGTNLVRIAGGRFTMGSDKHYPEEAPARVVTVDGFWIDQHPVTNEQFSRFVHDTGYVTFAERAPSAGDYPGAKPEMLFAGSVVFRKPKARVDLSDCYNWWNYVRGANWRHPQGPRSTLKGKAKHPVVHVAFQDAIAYAAWANKELPTEAEWEFAARGGLDGAEFAWGDELTPGDRVMANTWQGEFPYTNLLTDGYEGTSPVGAFAPNGYGLADMIGNVWEWTSDWYGSQPRNGFELLLRHPKSARRRPRGQLRSADPGFEDSAQSNEGWIASVRAELLPALSSGRAHGAADRYLDVSSGLSLCRARRLPRSTHS